MNAGFIRYAVRSDMGRVRKNNEDNLFCCGNYMMKEQSDLPYSVVGECQLPEVFAVFDGIGGEKNGEIASSIAAQTLSKYHDQLCESDPQNYGSVIDSYIACANKSIYDQSKIIGASMGTTAAIVIISKCGIHAFNVGDSRIYVCGQRKLQQISMDHTLAGKKLEAKQYTYNEARASSDWGKLTACLGIPKSNGEFDKISHLPVIPVKKGQKILICSDGLSDMLTDDVLERQLKSYEKPQKKAKKLMSYALNMGGKDNTTMIVLDICRRWFAFQ